ncbi:MAG: LytTR family transcriptional regulator DNA-binding domain-containing protein [Hymenobacteraceae bacterium]|nr:LytTR family transcriptional regulator DNA-binding domain-containing protein [Hymenobacteraceae bacterium]MDX5396050.1 LytTR family transcriptional regulator DNA-binding domain-containing protein [Hymenobacteraceae bacterium]MDX5444162.1 LytTR family transcriptional regulator DNA-binding domain-containing protein [Hymenobacteraceae bacterium]MDX5512111.1 LytTR family transcriptional regulator DNA-binding domain-containing protein [Hymenobacteraceae bacterium]
MAVPKILIVEDEIIIAEDIAASIEELGYEVCAIDTGNDIIGLIKETQPDLILLDIHIKGDRDGIETAAIIKEEFGIPFVFLTAYADKSTIDRAKKTEPHGFIVKPFDEKDLHSTIEIALYKYNKSHKDQPKNAAPETEAAITEISPTADHIFVKEKHRMIKVDLQDVLWVEAYDNYSFIMTGQKKYLVSSTLKDMENKLPSRHFVRIHRSYIVNLNKLDALEESAAIIREHTIPVGKSYKKALMGRFNIL